ncbi:MAG: diacylglycerol kinase [Clostridia bacterium]|nr:diacylglycerol kinase [Clostridia bacterium]MBQ2015640.1 diacylglycerol kinase [Clostridia bacterium]MBQ2567013.1 diacylglycerol kinase [Clostridia bacterium]MBQ4459079.1 diacylglycerol kinase [Clostridia bacterium]MBQ5481248.1 diacylglycerol kinase [Clostridia bacterium]
MEQKPNLHDEIQESPMRTTSFFNSIQYAFKGIGYALKTERNCKLYLVFLVFFFVVNLIVGVSLPGHIAYFICAFGAIAAEMINTAIEHICNYLTKDLDETIRRAKDLGAAAVLMWGFAYFPLEGVLIWLALSN